MKDWKDNAPLPNNATSWPAWLNRAARPNTSKPGSSKINRYRIVDPYLVFYFRFIEPSARAIKLSRGRAALSRYLPESKYDVWCGQAFEFLCCRHHHLIAEKLGFGAVQYECGSWFGRGADDRDAQIDLVFLRADRVITLCEVKFQNAPVGKGVIAEVEQKRLAFPNPKRQTIDTVLISASPPTQELICERYFSRILQLEDLFG